MTILEVRDAVVRYEDPSGAGVAALDRLCVAIEAGAFVVAVGASGCGPGAGARVRQSPRHRGGRMSDAPAAEPPAGVRAPARPLRRWRLSYVHKVAVVTIVAAVLAWALAARLEVVPAMFLPLPLDVARKLVTVWSEEFQDATLPQHALASLGRVCAAHVAAVLVGVPLGFAVNLSPTARGIVEPLLEIYRPISPLAYLPLVIIWFGIGEFAKVLVIFLGILPSLLIATDERPALGLAGSRQRRALARRHARPGRPARLAAARAADQSTVADRFAGKGGCKGALRYEGAQWRTLRTGVSLLVGEPAALDCVVTDAIERHSHLIVIGRVGDALTPGRGGALVYHNGVYSRFDEAAASDPGRLGFC